MKNTSEHDFSEKSEITLDTRKKSKISRSASFKEVITDGGSTDPSFARNTKTLRRSVMNDYELPVSDRESWWRCTIKETPSPLKYKTDSSFVAEIVKKPNTYRFKSDGRKHIPPLLMHQTRGTWSLPGAYQYQDFADRAKKLQFSYGFKNEPLEKLKNRSVTNLNPNLGPFTYETENYLTVSLPNYEPIRHSFFKSQIKRNIFPPPKEPTPAPGDYAAPILEREAQIEVTSCFKSESNRFQNKSRTFNTPGPGTYEPVSSWINSKQIQEFQQKGVFFTPSSKVAS